MQLIRLLFTLALLPKIIEHFELIPIQGPHKTCGIFFLQTISSVNI